MPHGRCGAVSRLFFSPHRLAGTRVLCGEAFAVTHDTDLGHVGVCACGAVTLDLFSEHAAKQDRQRKRKFC